MSIDYDKEYLELLKKNYDNLHHAVWEAHKTSWQVTGIFVPIISGGFGWFLKKYGDSGICLQKFLISFLLIAIVWFWYLMIKNFEGYNRTRFQQLKDLEKAFEKFHYYAVPREPQFKQYRLEYQGLFNKLCGSLALFLTGILACFLLWDISATPLWKVCALLSPRSIAGILFLLVIVMVYRTIFREKTFDKITINAKLKRVQEEIIRDIAKDEKLQKGKVWKKVSAPNGLSAYVWRRIGASDQHNILPFFHPDEERNDAPVKLNELFLKKRFLQRHTIGIKYLAEDKYELRWEVSVRPSVISKLVHIFEFPKLLRKEKVQKLKQRLERIKKATEK
jgi:hypothetical protein